MEQHIDQVLQYLQKSGKVRSTQIVKNAAVPRRSVFKALSLLVKRGQVRREGFHPKIYYSINPSVALAAPGEQSKAQPEAGLKLDTNKLMGSFKDEQEARNELSKVKHELYNCQNELNGKNLDLKSALAKIKYQEGEIEQVKKRSDAFYEETKRLRTDIQDLQNKLHEAQRQALLKKN